MTDALLALVALASVGSLVLEAWIVRRVERVEVLAVSTARAQLAHLELDRRHAERLQLSERGELRKRTS